MKRKKQFWDLGLNPITMKKESGEEYYEKNEMRKYYRTAQKIEFVIDRTSDNNPLSNKTSTLNY